MTLNLKYILGLICLPTFLTSCAHQCIYATYPGQENHHKIGVNTWSRTVELKQLGLSKTASNMPVARATLQNLSNEQHNVAYQISWVSPDGLPVAQNRGMIPLSLSPEENVIISGVNPSQSGKQFKLKVCQH